MTAINTTRCRVPKIVTTTTLVAVVVLTLVVASDATAQSGSSGMVVFGTSLSDPGNAFALSGEAGTSPSFMVLAAGGAGGQGSDVASVSARNALTTLCETYWYPLYAFLRSRGHSAEDAEDITQAFFARLLEKHTLRHADPDRGRFRSFMIATDRYMTFAEERNRPRSYDYPFTFVEIHLNKDGTGEGKMAVATQLQFDKKKNTIVFENYSTEPVRLTNVKVEK